MIDEILYLVFVPNCSLQKLESRALMWLQHLQLQLIELVVKFLSDCSVFPVDQNQSVGIKSNLKHLCVLKL